MSNRSRKPSQGKSLKLSAKDVVYVGLDVHKTSVHAAWRLNGREVDTWVMAADVVGIVRSLSRFKIALRQIVYEAGPTGYGLARALSEAGLPTQVVAPAKTPQPASRDSKSDRLDCRKLAEFAEKDLLKPVAIPTEAEEADRQVLRLRDQLMRKRRRVKQQIKSLLLQYGVAEPPGLKKWTKAGIAALSELELRPQIRQSLDALVEELGHLTVLLDRAKRSTEALSRQVRHRQTQRRLRTHPAVGVTLAMAWVTAVYQPQRFRNAEALTKYVGLAPRVSQTGKTRREGPLMKAGQGPLRALLVQAAWRWVGKELDAAVIFERIRCNTGSKQKAIVAVARRLAVSLWCMQSRGEDYRRSA